MCVNLWKNINMKFRLGVQLMPKEKSVIMIWFAFILLNIPVNNFPVMSGGSCRFLSINQFFEQLKVFFSRTQYHVGRELLNLEPLNQVSYTLLLCSYASLSVLNSSHTVAYNPNARRAYEKSQHAEDFGRIKINLFL